MKIREFSQRTGLSTHTLRYYEQLNLLQIERDASGHRAYSSQDVKWARCIRRLKEANMPLKDIQQFASLRHHCGGPDCQRLKILNAHKARLEELHAEILEHIEMINEEIDMYKEWNNL
ncbi:MerR family transcriptional regulator [Desulfovibrio inopinatus]|uniref:MerR family transcriptional regulator n=1 Tax=Desulfovibrio inopinatus TaxID=102109 RepID=UPI0004213FF3|nr:MerR family transcriptional regulator [Desulfovibrio inopinatus]